MGAHFSLKENKHSCNPKTLHSTNQGRPVENNWNISETNNTTKDVGIRHSKCFDVKKIDKISIIIFPLSFIIFNIVYWATFM